MNGVVFWYVWVGVFVIDVLFGFVVVVIMVLMVLMVLLGSVWWWLCVCLFGLIIFFLVVNWLLLLMIIGWSFGCVFIGIWVVWCDGFVIGLWWLLVWDLVYLVDIFLLFVGWLWLLWDLW